MITKGFSISKPDLTIENKKKDSIKIQKFLSQAFFVAEQFTGTPGQYVPLKETIRGFKEILEGKHDDLPEGAFYMVGTIDDAVAKAETMKAE